MKKIKKIVPLIGCALSLALIVSCASMPSAQVSPSSSNDKTAAENEEYLRSVNNDELSDIMAAGRYEAWLKFIDDESIRYWSNPKNLQRASKMLPVKGLRMNSLRDYFTYIYVPSRKGRKVDEIRYDSKTDVKAVQVSQDTDIIYYYFNKINGKWLVHIPPID